jgi:hypothetical protein
VDQGVATIEIQNKKLKAKGKKEETKKQLNQM